MSTGLERLAAEAIALAGGPHCCAKLGHVWEFTGGTNACCDRFPDPRNCGCSVPVHECSECGDCDYGDNEEADRVRAECKERNG